MPQYRIKKGMLTHPFSDLSGVCFYNAQTTVLTSVVLKEEELMRLLHAPRDDNDRDTTVIKELIEKDFIEEFSD